MIAPSRLILEALVTAHVRGRPLALLFDFDGTLTPLVAHPKLACLAAAARQSLHLLASLPRVAIGVVSGRVLADVRGKVQLPGLYYGGTSGLELELRSGTVVHPEAGLGQALVREAADLLAAVADEYPGAAIERKPLGLTLHFHDVPLARQRALTAQARRVFRPCFGSWRLVEGGGFLEITPAPTSARAAAVQAICADAGGDVLPLYAGDDDHDADALQAVARAGGIALGIGPRAPLDVCCRLASPRELHALLDKLRIALHPVASTPGIARSFCH